MLKTTIAYCGGKKRVIGITMEDFYGMDTRAGKGPHCT
jgi:hypothetical protein